ncbi:signal peptidase II [Rhizobiaceae bacterium BDR2-2]|uniref:Lipoprotein signal peptidase n=1 Tax=Ectorhizobium quercum TaxID=2965071 RepID=A0AAE3MWM6_9HYPH|nr:signal peptidase II [Ectorhizobium quercum]MCX8995771.1 signal peptidase II [Ectorhizobium quercum]
MTVERVPFFSRPAVAAVVVIVALVIDQIVKAAVEAWLPLHQDVPVLPFLALYRTYNLGVAFSLLADMDGWFIVGMRLIIVGFVLWLWKRTPQSHWLAHLGFALVIAGALGNIIDRFVYGHVVDYILFHTGNWSFAVFNLADTWISAGAALIFLNEFFAPKASDR